MTTLGPYTVHPFADRFPLLEGEEFEELVNGIKAQGLQQPIVLNHDRTILIDGRNRYRACEVAGVDLVYTVLRDHYTEMMILDYIVSTNIERRHLNAGQRAFLALDYLKAHTEAAEAARERQREAGRQTVKLVPIRTYETTLMADPPQSTSPEGRTTRERVAKAVGAAGRTVQYAKAVERDAPDLAARVRSGQISIDAADKARKDRFRSQPKPEITVVQSTTTMLTLRTHAGEAVEYPQPKSKSTFNLTPGDGISWAEWSWNPVTGCLHGCNYCYARGIATNARYANAYPVGFTPLFHHERLEAPANTVIPAVHRDDPAWRRVFVCSMADLYGQWVPEEWINQVHASMLASPQWEYLLLTKFPSRYVKLDLPPSAWVGTSVDEQKRVRIAEDAFRQIDGVAVKWLSLEPLLEPLEFTDLSMFDWIVIGAQTATYQPTGPVPAFAPPFEWVARLIDQAREAGCKVHMKPNLGPEAPGMTLVTEYPVAVGMAATT